MAHSPQLLAVLVLLASQGVYSQSKAGDCDFDRGLCGYTQDNTDEFDWRQWSGRTGTGMTGPNGDHTTGSGKYMYIEASSPRTEGDKARLISPMMQQVGARCLEFYYHLFGSHIDMSSAHRVLIGRYFLRHIHAGALNVYKLPTGLVNLHEPIWTATGDRGIKWLRGQVTVESDMDYQVVFEGARGSGIRGDIALDDITFSDGPCVTDGLVIDNEEALPEKADCNFDNGLCDYVQDKDDVFDWRLKAGRTPTTATGPRGDHTSGKGKYLYMEASRKQEGHHARIMTPNLRPSPLPKCLVFWYHMFGQFMGEFNIYLRLSQNDVGAPVWSQAGNKGPSWHQGRVNIQANHTFQVVFEAVRGRKARGDIALDDVSFEDGPCAIVEPTLATESAMTTTLVPVSTTISTPPAQTTRAPVSPSSLTCSFDDSLCGYTAASTRSQLAWVQWASTDSLKDHTSGEGSFMMVQVAASGGSPGDTRSNLAWLLTPWMTAEGIYCLEFFAYVQADGSSGLTVYQTIGEGGAVRKLWNNKGKVGAQWTPVRVDIWPTSKFQIKFEGHKSQSSQARIGLDDVTFRAGRCPSKVPVPDPKPTTPMQRTTKTEPREKYSTAEAPRDGIPPDFTFRPPGRPQPETVSFPTRSPANTDRKPQGLPDAKGSRHPCPCDGSTGHRHGSRWTMQTGITVAILIPVIVLLVVVIILAVISYKRLRIQRQLLKYCERGDIELTYRPPGELKDLLQGTRTLEQSDVNGSAKRTKGPSYRGKCNLPDVSAPEFGKYVTLQEQDSPVTPPAHNNFDSVI
ncbi:MAM and LDL-receptor class A domain-containing protein 1-like isoform X1 [Branchiostoma floridae]|uniref:MAM and LDL-receptor class A domain-containing protein 1-like isoform X1 n=2 Tax=Branchiostoma floridae TaxID=7739 RepID=A0A9J7KMD5_BRAFL|nr:MAM and LDL-receptor class A domain-containing protein 1-like isoform X1 [Branchiostoma floridae]